MKARIATVFFTASLALSAVLADGEGAKRLVIGDVPQHTVGAYRPFTIPGEIRESDGMVEMRKGREIVVWCPERIAKEKPKKLAAAKKFVESPFLPVLSVSVGYVGDKAGESILKGLGVEYTAYTPNELWRLAEKQVTVLGPGTEGLFKSEKLRDALKKKLASCALVVLPGADLSLLPFGLSRAKVALPSQDAKVPAIPLFAGTGRDFADFNRLAKGFECPVLASGPAWMLPASPACIAHVKCRGHSMVVFNVAPSDVPEAARPALTRVWCTILANLNIESGVGAR